MDTDTAILIIFREKSNIVESIEVSSDRKGVAEKFQKHIGRAILSNYSLGDVFELEEK